MRDTARSTPARASATKRAPAAPGPGHDALELQRAVGNRAARTLLSRETAEADTERDTSAIDIDGIGVIPLQSFSFGLPGPGGGSPGGRGREREQPQIRDFTFTCEHGEHSAKIMRAATEGQHIETAVITSKGMTITLKGVVVSGYSMSGAGGSGAPTEQVTLSFESIEYKHVTGG
jgi:type VI protein secretion system component Hcp